MKLSISSRAGVADIINKDRSWQQVQWIKVFTLPRLGWMKTKALS
jgi:hypothetical protein